MVIASLWVIRTIFKLSLISLISIALDIGVLENTASLNIVVCIEDSSDSLVHINSLFVKAIIQLCVDVLRSGPSHALSNAEGSVASELSDINVSTWKGIGIVICDWVIRDLKVVVVAISKTSDDQMLSEGFFCLVPASLIEVSNLASEFVILIVAHPSALGSISLASSLDTVGEDSSKYDCGKSSFHCLV